MYALAFQNFRVHASHANRRDVWGELASRCNVQRTTAKNWAYLLGYHGEVDPWVDHIVKTELMTLTEELSAGRSTTVEARRHSLSPAETGGPQLGTPDIQAAKEFLLTASLGGATAWHNEARRAHAALCYLEEQLHGRQRLRQEASEAFAKDPLAHVRGRLDDMR